MMGGNDAEILAIAARVADTGPRPPADTGPRPPPGPPPSWLLPKAQLDEGEPCQWSPGTPAEPEEDEDWGDWRPTRMSLNDTVDSDGDCVMAKTDVGEDCTHASEPAPTFVSLATPLNSKGQLVAPGGQILHIDSSGHVLNANNERCDLHGRPTRPRGCRGSKSQDKYRMQYWGSTTRPGFKNKEWQWGDDWNEDEWKNNEWKTWGQSQRWNCTAVPRPPPTDAPEGQPQAQGEGHSQGQPQAGHSQGQPQALGAGSSSSTECWASRGWSKDEWSAYLVATKK